MAQATDQSVSGPTNETESFGLDEVLAALSRDLMKAEENASEGEAFGLYVGSAVVELQFTVQRTRTKGGGGAISFKVFGVGADVDARANSASSEETIHKITLTLTTRRSTEPAEPPGEDEIMYKSSILGLGTSRHPGPVGTFPTG
jgi:hypothetical protein